MDPLTILGIGQGIGAIANMFSQSSTNRANRDLAFEQMGFQERMSNTAYTRAMRDMGNAGLNPALMFGSGSAASTPTGASAKMEAPQLDLGGAVNAISSAYQAKQTQAQTDKIKSDTGLNAGIARINAAQAANTEAQSRINSAEATKAEQSADWLKKNQWIIPIKETLGGVNSALSTAGSAASIWNAVRPQNLGKGTLTDGEKSVLKSYNKGQGPNYKYLKQLH